MTAHALLSASGAARWMHCTGSPKLERDFPDTTSAYAKEGTLAHAFCELKLRKFAVEPMGKSTYTRRLNRLKKEPEYQKEMDGYTDDYLDRVKAIILAYPHKPHVACEQRVDFSAWVPGGFGTADCIVVGDDILHIVDFKYGKGVEVDAHGNPQMRLYALGAVALYKMLWQIRTVRMTIIQPRLGNYSTDEMPYQELLDWAEKVVKPAAQEAAGEQGHFEPGDWCRFCRAKQQCKARAEYFAAMAKDAEAHPDPRLMTPEDLGRYLKAAKLLKAWAEDMQEYGLTRCLDGKKEVPGWKAVEGRGSRAFTDQEAAFKVLMDHGTEEAMLYNRVPLTLAQAEKVVGKKEFAALVGSYIDKKPGKPTLVPEADKRPAITNKPTAEQVFTKMEMEE